MKLPSRKLDFLLIYVIVSISTVGVIRSIIIRLADWMKEFSAVVYSGEF